MKLKDLPVGAKVGYERWPRHGLERAEVIGIEEVPVRKGYSMYRSSKTSKKVRIKVHPFGARPFHDTVVPAKLFDVTWETLQEDHVHNVAANEQREIERADRAERWPAVIAAIQEMGIDWHPYVTDRQSEGIPLDVLEEIVSLARD